MNTQVGDLVLIHHRQQAVVYARVEEILADGKPGWWQVRLMMLQIPPREVTWILRDEYIDGEEFTMGGDVVQLTPVPAPAPSPKDPEPEELPLPDIDVGGDGKVVSLADRLRNKTDKT